MAIQFTHSGDGPITAGLDENGTAWAEFQNEDGTIQRFEEQVVAGGLDPYELVRRQHSKALAAFLESEEAKALQALPQELGAVVLAALDTASDEVALAVWRLAQRGQALAAKSADTSKG